MSGEVMLVEHDAVDCSVWKNTTFIAPMAVRSMLLYSASEWGMLGVALMALMHRAQF